ncbi:Homoserine kinase [Candidatus Entotheonellaceae bacterium PAL068K]
MSRDQPVGTPAFFPVQRSILSTQALTDQILTKYAFGSPATCHLFNRGRNDSYLVTAGDFKCYLRIPPSGERSREHIAAEIDLLNFLDRHQISVPKPIGQKDGTYIHELHAPEGVRYAVAFTYVDGAPPAKLSKAQSALYGTLAATIHTLTDQHPQPYTRFHHDLDYMVNEPLQHLTPIYAQRQEDVDYLMAVAQLLRREAERLPRTPPEYGICHGDLRLENAHFHAHGLSLIDFDESGYGWRAYDISTFFWPQVFPTPVDQQRQLRDAFLHGYQSVRPLSDVELQVLPYFVALRHIWAFGTGIRCSAIDLGMKIIVPFFEPGLQFIKDWLAENG